MIQFNLLPDVKQEYIKSRRLKRLISLISGAVAGLSLVIFIFLLVLVDGIQKKNISDLSKSISTESNQLKNNTNLDKILTVQNQLGSLSALHAQKPVVSKLFSYLPQLTPAQISISKLEADFGANTLSITGSTDTLQTVNTFVDTLKFTTYTLDGDTTTPAKPAFSGVVLFAFTRDAKGATYTVKSNYDPIILSGAHTATLTVPKIITTRSEVDQPTDLFQKPVIPPTPGGH